MWPTLSQHALRHDARRIGHSASARRALSVGLPLPPIARHALTHSSPSYCQVDAPSSVARQDSRNLSSLSGLDAQGSAETDLRYSERKDVLFMDARGWVISRDLTRERQDCVGRCSGPHSAGDSQRPLHAKGQAVGAHRRRRPIRTLTSGPIAVLSRSRDLSSLRSNSLDARGQG